MATTAVLHANDLHKADQSPHSVRTTNSPLLHGYSPSQGSSYNFAGVSPAEAATASNSTNSTYLHANYPLQPSRDVYQNLTPEPPSGECTSFIELGTASLTEISTAVSSATSNIIYVRDPFYEPPRRRSPITQPPTQYPNTGNPSHSGIQLDLPRNVRVPYPESAFEALALVNKTFVPAGGMCMPPRQRHAPYLAAPMRSPAYVNHPMSNSISPSYASPTPPPGGMPPSYPMHSVRPMACLKTSAPQMQPASYQYYSPTGNTTPNIKKPSPLTTAKKGKQNSKGCMDERAPKGSRKNDFCMVPVNNIYDPVCDMGRPSTSAAGNFAMVPGGVTNNQGMGMVGRQSPSSSNPSTSQMMTPTSRTPYQYEGGPVQAVGPNMQIYEPMRMMGSPGCELMQPPPLPVMRSNGHINGVKTNVDTPALPKTHMFAQQNSAMPDMQHTDGYRMCDTRPSIKSPQYQASPLAHTSGQINDVYSNINGNISNSPNYMQQNPMILQRCGYCKEEFRAERIGIQCTGNNQGCRRYFHQECSQLMPESFHAILNEPRAEWICNECASRQQITYS